VRGNSGILRGGETEKHKWLMGSSEKEVKKREENEKLTKSEKDHLVDQRRERASSRKSCKVGKLSSWREWQRIIKDDQTKKRKACGGRGSEKCGKKKGQRLIPQRKGKTQ